MATTRETKKKKKRVGFWVSAACLVTSAAWFSRQSVGHVTPDEMVDPEVQPAKGPSRIKYFFVLPVICLLVAVIAAFFLGASGTALFGAVFVLASGCVAAYRQLGYTEISPAPSPGEHERLDRYLIQNEFAYLLYGGAFAVVASFAALINWTPPSSLEYVLNSFR